ncbi:T9SS type A sorting domain-containing protein [candidate division KSB1 bacterium]|nr:T9SS type A sorting domain-containing protein [candidate division KSB1 bacterium]
MREYSFVAVVLLFSCANPNQAQEPRWELFARGLYGAIAVDPTNSDIVYISFAPRGVPLGGMWKTTDGGQNWKQYKEGWLAGTARDILIDPTNPNVVLVGGESLAAGIIKSVDGGQTWFRADTGLVPDHHGYMVWSLALDNQRRIFYAGHQGIFGGVFHSSDGVHWQNLTPSYPFDPLDLTVDKGTGVLYAASFSGVWKSMNSGSTWVHISNGLRIGTIWHVVKLKQSNTLYAATARGIYKTLDGGNNWFSVNDSVTSKLSFWGGLIVAEKDTNTIYAGAEATLNPAQPGGIYLSRNSGDSWALYNFGLPDTVLDLHVTNLFFDNRTNILYASVGSILRNGRSEVHVYRLRNAVTTAVREPRYAPYSAQLTLYSYPNPVNKQTTFIFSVYKKGRVQLRLFNILGKEVMTLLDEQRGPGEYRIPWGGINAAGKRLSSGIYLAKLQLGNEVKTIKLLLTQ